MESTKRDEDQIEIRFLAHQSVPENFKVTETPFHVPVQLARLGLSGVINHLLDLGKNASASISSLLFHQI